MKKLQQKIIRKSDKHWLISAEQDAWTPDETKATVFNLKGETVAESFLIKKYKYTDFNVVDV